MKFKSLLVSSVLLFPFHSQADVLFADSSGIEGNNYIGIHASLMDYQEDNTTGYEFEVEGGAIRVGHEFNNYLAIEGQIGLTNDDEYLGVDTGIDYFVGLYARGNLFLFNPSARVYGLIGVTHAKFTATLSDDHFSISDSESDTALAYGVGIEFYGNSRNGINLELMRYMDGKENDIDYTLDAVNLGYIHRF